MNEGWATFWHYTLLNTLYDQSRVSDGFILEFLHAHTNVVYQPPQQQVVFQPQPVRPGLQHVAGPAPDLRGPRRRGPGLVPRGGRVGLADHVQLRHENFKDESFIAQYLSPRLMREFRFFSVVDDDTNPKLRVGPIHDDQGYQTLRRNWPTSTTWAAGSPTSRSGTWTGAATGP